MSSATGSFLADKAKADDAFRSKNFSLAYALYSAAIGPLAEASQSLTAANKETLATARTSHQSFQTYHHRNRSACAAALGQFENALSDAESCIQYRKEWNKGYYRKAFALKGLGHCSSACSALHSAIKHGHPASEYVPLAEELLFQSNRRDSLATVEDFDLASFLVQNHLRAAAAVPLLSSSGRAACFSQVCLKMQADMKQVLPLIPVLNSYFEAELQEDKQPIICDFVAVGGLSTLLQQGIAPFSESPKSLLIVLKCISTLIKYGCSKSFNSGLKHLYDDLSSVPVQASFHGVFRSLNLILSQQFIHDKPTKTTTDCLALCISILTQFAHMPGDLFFPTWIKHQTTFGLIVNPFSFNILYKIPLYRKLLFEYFNSFGKAFQSLAPSSPADFPALIDPTSPVAGGYSPMFTVLHATLKLYEDHVAKRNMLTVLLPLVRNMCSSVRGRLLKEAMYNACSQYLFGKGHIIDAITPHFPEDAAAFGPSNKGDGFFNISDPEMMPWTGLASCSDLLLYLNTNDIGQSVLYADTNRTLFPSLVRALHAWPTATGMMDTMSTLLNTRDGVNHCKDSALYAASKSLFSDMAFIPSFKDRSLDFNWIIKKETLQTSCTTIGQRSLVPIIRASAEAFKSNPLSIYGTPVDPTTHYSDWVLLVLRFYNKCCQSLFDLLQLTLPVSYQGGQSVCPVAHASPRFDVHVEDVVDMIHTLALILEDTVNLAAPSPPAAAAASSSASHPPLTAKQEKDKITYVRSNCEIICAILWFITSRFGDNEELLRLLVSLDFKDLLVNVMRVWTPTPLLIAFYSLQVFQKIAPFIPKKQ